MLFVWLSCRAVTEFFFLRKQNRTFLTQYRKPHHKSMTIGFPVVYRRKITLPTYLLHPICNEPFFSHVKRTWRFVFAWSFMMKIFLFLLQKNFIFRLWWSSLCCLAFRNFSKWGLKVWFLLHFLEAKLTPCTCAPSSVTVFKTALKIEKSQSMVYCSQIIRPYSYFELLTL